MKHLKFVLLPLALIALAASAWLFRQPHADAAKAQIADSSPSEGAADQGNTTNRPAGFSPAVLELQDPAHVAIENRVSLMSALTTHAVNGQIESEAQANLALLAGNCHETPNLAPATSEGFAFDDTRAWAIARQLEICAGYDPSQFKVTVPRPDLMGSLRKHGWEATKPMVTETIASSGITVDVFTAGQLMMENDSFPFDEVLPGMQKSYGPQEITSAWLRASQLATCEKVGGCGKDSFEVVLVCAKLGCKEGLNLMQALEQRLPPSDFRATVAMYSWLKRRRSAS